MNNDIKVAFLTPEYPHPKTPGLCGGIGTSIKNLGSALVNLGVKVSVLVYGQDSDGFFHEDGIDFYRIKNSPSRKWTRYKTQKKIEKLINELVREQKINLVEAGDWTGITSFIKPKCPVVVKVHGSDTYFAHLAGNELEWKKRFAEKRALRKANDLLSVSKYAGDVTHALVKPKKQFTVIPNGIDIGKFSPQPEAVVPDTILYFGTLVRKKGTLELPPIFNAVYQKNPNAKLMLVGLDSNDPKTGNSSVWQMIQPMFDPEALKNVTYAGNVDYSEIGHYISRSAVCVFPSYAEALPVSWMEAMAMGKAVVASDIGWAKEMIVDGKEGFLVHPADHQHYADRILELLSDTQLQQTFGKNAREKAATSFGFEVVAAQHLKFYDSVLKNYNWRK